jgi:hypothetical protein
VNPVEGCGHRVVHVHGTRAAYVAHKCRCPTCQASNRVYAEHRNRAKVYGRWDPYLDAGPVRAHIRQLAACGMGRRRVAALAGVADSVVTSLLFAKRGKPVLRVRRETADRILAVAVDLAPSAVIDGTGTRRRLQGLVASGWSQAALAARLGWTPGNFGTLIHADRVLVRTAGAVGAVFDELGLVAPPAGTPHRRASVTRARRHAEARGWAPPLAWDDGSIDDPAAFPGDWRRLERRTRRTVDVAEDAEFLLGQGESLEQVAVRLGMTLPGLRQALYREAVG